LYVIVQKVVLTFFTEGHVAKLLTILDWNEDYTKQYANILLKVRTNLLFTSNCEFRSCFPVFLFATSFNTIYDVSDKWTF